MGKNAGECRFCKKEFGDKYAHEKRCPLNPNKQYVECQHCQKSVLQANMRNHYHCPRCNQCFDLIKANFDLHTAKHATIGEGKFSLIIYSENLERLFSKDQLKIQKALKTGRKFVDEIKKHFKDRHNREKTTYYVYLILKAHKQGLLSFKEFCECIVYVGRGQAIRIDQHGLGDKEASDGLRAFFEQCFEDGVQPTAFIPFVELLSDEEVYPSNLANVDFGSMPGFDWTSDDMAAAGSWFLHEAYQIYLKTSFDLDRKQKKVVVFDKPNKWHIKLSKKSLVEKQIYTGKELMKKSNPKDARYVKLPSNLTADQITQVLALLSSGDHDLLQLLKEKNDEKEPDQKRQRLN